MKLGIHVTVDGRPGRGPAFLREVATTAEELGFDSLWVGDHLVEFADYGSRHPHRSDGRHPSTARGLQGRYEPFLALTACATWTSRLRLGTAVTLLTERNPVLTAGMVSTLDHLSGGRFDFGVGVGWLREEHEALGVPFEDRGARCDDYLKAMLQLWTSAESTYHGAYVSFERVLAYPKPVTEPHPPLYIGGSSPAALRRVARFGDGWIPVFLPADELERLLGHLHALLGAEGRRPEDVAVAAMYVLDDPGEQRARAREHADALSDLPVDQLVLKPRLDLGNHLDVLTDLADELVEARH